MAEFTVEVHGHYKDTAVYTVEAETEADARALGSARYHTEHPGWDGAVREAKVVTKHVKPAPA